MHVKGVCIILLLLGVSSIKPESFAVNFGAAPPYIYRPWLVSPRSIEAYKTLGTGLYRESHEPNFHSPAGIELVSAFVDDMNDNSVRQPAKKLRVMIYLKSPCIVINLSIQGVSPEYDKSFPKNLKCGDGPKDEFKDIFEVVSDKASITPGALNVIARINGNEEYIAPAIIYHSHQPKTIGRYGFAFKVSRTATLSVKFQRKGIPRAKPICTDSYERKTAGVPFTVVCDLSKQPPGEYEIVAKGKFLNAPKQPFAKTIVFTHQPHMKGK